MTDTTRVTIDEIASAAITEPDDLSHAEITRLGTWFVDHEAHITAHNRLVATTTSVVAPTGNRTQAQQEARAKMLDADPEQTGLVGRVTHMKPDTEEAAE